MTDYNPHDWFWIVGGDESRFWSSAAGAYVEELPDGWYSHVRGAVWAMEDEEAVSIPTHIASEAELDDVLAVHGMSGPTARPKRRKSTIQLRLIAAGKMEEAFALLTLNPVLFARWFSPDPEHYYVYADDPEALALLQAIKADAKTIMAAD